MWSKDKTGVKISSHSMNGGVQVQYCCGLGGDVAWEASERRHWRSRMVKKVVEAK